MAITIAPKPPEFDVDPSSPTYQNELLKYQEQMSSWMMNVTEAFRAQAQESTMQADLLKLTSDTLNRIAGNIR
jgi:hypothetical protein